MARSRKVLYYMQYSSVRYSLKTLPRLSYEGLISSIDASVHFNITNDYVTRLCRQKKIEGVLIGRLWFVSKKSLKEYLGETRLKRQAQREMLSEQLSREYRSRFAVPKPK